MPFSGIFNRFTSNTVVDDTQTSTYPPSYYTDLGTTPAPTYQSNVPRTISARGSNNTSVRALSSSLPSASRVSSLESDAGVDSSVADTASTIRTSVEKGLPGPRYIYYRVYAENGAIPSANSVYIDDPYLGRISAELVTPPLTAVNLKRCISGMEGIDEKTASKLFISASSQAPMHDDCRVSIFAYPGPGCEPNEPMALVVMRSQQGRAPCQRVPAEAEHILPPESTTPFKTQYLYYRVYKKRRAVKSKRPADPSCPWIGRISVDSVPPPHTATSIIRCISKAEEFDNSEDSQLWSNSLSESPIRGEHVSILTSNRPGSTPEDPMAFVKLPDPVDLPSSDMTYEPVASQMRGTIVPPHKQNRGWLKVRRVSQEAVTPVKISTGRGGAGNVRSLSGDIERKSHGHISGANIVPQGLSSRRGGESTIRSASTSRYAKDGPEHPQTSGINSITEYERGVMRRPMEAQKEVHVMGRGGLGNIFTNRSRSCSFLFQR
ncbi:hypothetical protein PILCRDRAFT_602777 [Piloderma croceum F 1598]|uniref:Uncharacterized protein n=1 Tax=Piloderma croceum (strain F 1598) TaxID=765440 RepID=A0A0C3EZV8_PILCF|nr:hypothetical protein PILCRDRAFT_602777 [Piloderma croceum F 1598]